MADEFKLGIVPNPVIHSPTPRLEDPKLGVVSASAPQTLITPPGLGVIRPGVTEALIPAGIPIPLTYAVQEIDLNRIYQIKLTWVNSQGNKDSDQVLRNAANEIYSSLHLPPPAIYRFQSPLAAMLAARHLGRIYGIDVDHTPDMLEQLRQTLSKYLGPIDEEKRRNDELCHGLTVELAEPLKSQLNSKFLDRFTDQMTSVIGSLEASTRLFDPISYRVMEWWRAIANSRCWWWPYSRFLVVSDGPAIHYDEEGRVHRSDGPAMEFADGCAVYFYCGWRVQERVVLHPGSLTTDEIDMETNAEVRRIMIERFGYGNYFQKSGACVLDMDTLTLEGSAPRALLVDKRGDKWLVGTDGSTARVYTMPVQRGVYTCRQAHEGISGFDESRLIAEA